TPTETRVAELVASGHSNKEVAAQLYMSVKTVEANLSRVFAKLGVRSRTELAARAAAGRLRGPGPEKRAWVRAPRPRRPRAGGAGSGGRRPRRSGCRAHAVEEAPDQGVCVRFARHRIAGRKATTEPRVAAADDAIEPDDGSSLAPVPRVALRQAALRKGGVTGA